MARCTYEFHGVKFGSYAELADYLMGNDTLMARQMDVLFSSRDTATETNLKLDMLKGERRLAKEGRGTELTPLEAEPEGFISAQRAVDEEWFTVNGERPDFKMSRDDFRAHLIGVYTTAGMTRTQAEAKAETRIAKRFDKVADDAYDFHVALGTVKDNSYESWRAATSGTAFGDPAMVRQLAGDKDHEGVGEQIFGKVLRGSPSVRHEGASGDGEGTTFHRNISVTGEIRNVPDDAPKKMIAHADYVAVRDDGRIDLYNVKTSTEAYNDWSREKVDHYRYEMSFLKRLLSQKGVDTSRMTLNIIPVQLEYDADFTRVERVNVQNAVPLDMYRGRVMLDRYDAVCAKYVDGGAEEARFDFHALDEATAMLGSIFPGTTVRAQGITLEARDWADRWWASCDPKQTADGGWELTMPDNYEKVKLKDPGRKSGNKEFVKWIERNMTDGHESFTGSRSAARLVENIKDSINRYGYYNTEYDGANKLYMKELMSPYFFNKVTHGEEGEVKTFDLDWTEVRSDALTAANVVGLKNKRTGQLDLICVSPNDPGGMCRLGPYDNLLAGVGLTDVNDHEFVMSSEWGNIEAVRVLALLDSIAGAGELGGDYKLGKLHVVCLNGRASKKGTTYDLRSLAGEWSKIVRIVNTQTKGKAGLKDRLNTSGVKFITTEEVLMQMWRGIVNYGGWSFNVTTIRNFKDIFEGHYDQFGTFIPGLADAGTSGAKIGLLIDLMHRIRALLNDTELSKPRDMKEIIKLSRQEGSFGGVLARLYMAAGDMLRVQTGTYVPYVDELTALDSNMSRPGVVRQSSHQKCVALVGDSIGLINSRVTDRYMLEVKPHFDQLYIDAGYGKMRAKVIGDTTELYKNMFVRDEHGENTFRLKNPYDMSNDLLPYERKFLRNVLYEFYRIRCDVMRRPLDITGVEDPKLKTAMPAGYLNLPLQRASKVSQWTDFKGMLERFGNAVVDTVGHPFESLKRLKDYITDTSAIDYANGEYERMQLVNRYAEQEEDFNSRLNEIRDKGAKWFETDIENVFIDYLYTQRRVEEMNNLWVKIDAIELALALRGEEYNDTKGINRIIEAIDDYVKNNVYKGSNMEKQSLYLEKGLKGLRKLTSEILFGGNAVGFIRDIFYGLQSNFVSAVAKYHTNISVKNLEEAYVFVMKDCFKNLFDMGLLNSLNIKYGFSSFDYGDVSNKLKRQTGALFNWSSFLYWTMKAPDYLNRMTLFVARLKQDGSFKAYSCDENGNARYDWRKDERFSELAKGDAADKSSEKYRRQLGKYCDLIAAFNAEDPTLNLKTTDDLPDGYTMREIRSIKRLGEELYGAYDKASRNRLEHMAIGRNFLFFFTFFNGINEIYFKKTGRDERTLKEVRETNEEGKELFWRIREDGSQELTTDDTGVPAYKMVSAIDQGIFASLKQMFRCLSEGMTVKEYYETNVKGNDIVKANYKRLFLDMGITAIFTVLLGALVKPAYKRRKEEMDPQAVAENIAVELLYRGWSRSADFFSGPLAILKYFGDSTNPVTYDMGTKMLNDVYKLIAGKQGFGETALSYSAFYRGIQDSTKAFYRDMARQNGTAAEEEARKREKEQRKGKTGTVK